MEYAVFVEDFNPYSKRWVNENSYTRLNSITYIKNVLNIFGTEASETLKELYGKFAQVINKISLSAGATKIDFDELNGYLHDNGWIEYETFWLEWGPFKNNNTWDQLFYAEVMDYYMFLPIDLDKDIPDFISSLKSYGLYDWQIIQSLDKIKSYWIAKTSILYPLDVIKACLVNETSYLISDILIDEYIGLYPQLIPFFGGGLSEINDWQTHNITEEYYLKYLTKISQSFSNDFFNEEGWTDLYVSTPNCTQNPDITVRVLEDFKKRIEKVDFYISNLSTDFDNEGDDTPPTDDGNSDGGQDTPPTDDNDPQPNIVAEPFFSQNSGTYDHLLHIEISTATPDAIVRYTINGNDPSPLSGTIYTNPILIASKTTVKAIAYIPNNNQSELTSATFDISGADINCENFYFDGCMELSTVSMFSVKQGESIYFEAGVKGAKSPYEFHWAFDYENYSRQESLAYTFSHPGNQIATLTVTDKNNNFAKENINIYVSKNLKANILLPSSIAVGEKVTFTAEVAGGIDEYLYDSESYPYEYNWDLGDGKYSNTKEPNHIYSSAGKHTVRLTIKDIRGDTITDVKEVIVSENDNTPNGNYLIGTWLVSINYITLNGQKYTEVVDTNGIIYSVEDFYSNVVIFNNGTLNYSDYLWGSYQTSGSGRWTYDESTEYFKASADGDLVSGIITGTINNFEVAGTYEGLSVSYHFKRQ